MLLRPSKSLILLEIHQALKVFAPLLANGDLGNPAAAVRVVLGHLVDGPGLLLEGDVGPRDGAGDRRIDVGGALDGLDGAQGVARHELPAFLGQLDVDDVAEFLRGVLGDADHPRGLVCVEVYPLVVFGVFADVPCFKRSGVISLWFASKVGIQSSL